MQCESCRFKFTNPRPSEDAISVYYQSEAYISHSNTTKGIVNILYQVARKITVGRKIKLINSLYNQDKLLLDYGCGTGEFLAAAKKMGWGGRGIEPDSKARKFAIEHHSLEVGSPNEIGDMPANTFDIISLWHVLEHIHQLNESIIRLKTLLKPKGKLIVAVPNSDSYDAKLYGEYWAAYDVPRHLYHFNADSISKLFNNHDFKLTDVKPMWLDAFYVSMLSEKYRKTNLGFLRGILTGGITDIKALFNNKNVSSLIFIFENK